LTAGRGAPTLWPGSGGEGRGGAGESLAPPSRALPAATVTFLFTGLAGSTALPEADPRAYR
jgi:hypothetical protein